METSLLIIVTALFAIGFFCTLVSSIFLLSSKDARSPANRYLVYFLFIMSLAMFMNFMILGKFIVHVPFLYRLPSPLFYFLAPSAYLYVRMVLLDERHARKTDWLHAIPALLHLAEMMPFYLSSNETKLARIVEDSGNTLGSMAHAEGWLPVYAHSFLWGCQGTVYAILIMMMIWKSREKRPAGILFFPEMIQWLWVFSGMLLLLGITFVLTFLIPGINPALRSGFLYIIMAATQIVAGLYLLLNSSILFGMPRLEKLVAQVNLRRSEILFDPVNPDMDGVALLQADESFLANDLDFPVSSHPAELVFPLKGAGSQLLVLNEETVEARSQMLSHYDHYIRMLTHLMEEKKPFLRKRYSISDLSKDANIPQHHISYLLNNIFQIRFNEYINQFRIKYIKDRVAHEEIGHLTLEGLALEAGFNSRITFIRVVKKQTGMNPSEYFKSDMA